MTEPTNGDAYSENIRQQLSSEKMGLTSHSLKVSSEIEMNQKSSKKLPRKCWKSRASTEYSFSGSARAPRMRHLKLWENHESKNPTFGTLFRAPQARAIYIMYIVDCSAGASAGRAPA